MRSAQSSYQSFCVRGNVPAAAAGVDAFFRQQAAAVTQGHWQILQLAKTHTPGVLHAWVLSGGGMYCVPIRVPRILYINSELPPGNPAAAVLGAKTSRILPKGARALNVYRVCSFPVVRPVVFSEYTTIHKLLCGCSEDFVATGPKGPNLCHDNASAWVL